MTPLKLTVIGCGYLGAVHAAAMAHLGHHVLGIDTRPEQVEALSQGRAPFYEPGLPELLVTGARQGDLRFTSTPTPAELAEADVPFDAKPFKAHVTIARKVDLRSAQLPQLGYFPAARVRTAALFESELSQEGARYRILHEVEL